MAFGLWSVYFAVTLASTGPLKLFRPRFPLARSYPELFRVTGPLLSLVFRTEDVCQRNNQYTENVSELSIRVSPSRSYNAGRAGLGWMRERQSLHAVVVLWFWH